MLRTLPALLLAGAFVSSASAADHTIQDQVVQRLNSIEEKLVQLAEAMPQEKMSWRPMEGVRSPSEVFMHVAAANYFIAGALGAETPSDVNPREFEKSVTDKADVAAKLKDSFAFARKAVEEADPEEATKLFGQESTKQGAMLVLVEHASEHLGQSIAYARMNEVVPPWSN